MQHGYEALIWVDDVDGKKYACFADDLGREDLENQLFFNVEEFSRCLDIDKLVGTSNRFSL